MSDPSPISAPSPAATDLSGRQLGDYRLLRRIGQGAMADVYLSEQLSLGRQVALKILRRELAEDDSYIKRFQNEARAAASLVHANIVQIYEVGRSDNIHFIALEYVPGQNLRQLLTRHGPLDAPLAVNIMRQVGAALHRAAERDLIHRDIKPENIMISSSGEVKVADFGLSRTAGAGKTDLTQVGITMGTPLYMSPEQAEGRELDPRSDLYSFGVTCYHMLSGRPPFEGDTALAVAMQHVRSQAERLENLRPDLPEGLCRVVHQLLAKQPEQRYQRAAELMHDLKSLQIDGAGGTWNEGLEDWSTSELIALADARVAATQRLGTLMKSAALKTSRPGRAWTWMLALGIVVVFLVGGLVAWLNREPPLLARAPDESVNKLESAEAQYWHAMHLHTEPAYRAVWEYFPQDEYYGMRARQQAARIYLEQDQLEPAARLFQKLAGSSEVQFRAFALAGQALVHARRREMQQAAGKLAELVPHRDHLDPDMNQRIDQLSKNLSP